MNPLEKKIIFIFLAGKKNHQTISCGFFLLNDDLIKSDDIKKKTFDDFFFTWNIFSQRPKKNEKPKHSKNLKKNAVIQKKEDFLLFSFKIIQSNVLILTFFFSISLHFSLGMFVSYYFVNLTTSLINFLKKNSHLELLRRQTFRLSNPPRPPISSSNQSLCCNYLTIARVRQFCHLKKTKRVQEKNANKKNIESQFDLTIYYWALLVFRIIVQVGIKVQVSKISKINKSAGWNKAMQVGILGILLP